jgi:predicted nucleotidyltransferase
VIDQIQARRTDIAQLCRQYHVRRLAVFGSAVSGDFDPQRSDLDFLVEFEPLEFGQYTKTYFGLLDSLAALFARKVDLVICKYVINPYMRQSIEASQALLYAA